MRIRTNVRPKHARGCAAVAAVARGDWSTPWGPQAWGRYGEPSFWGTIGGHRKRRNNTKWLVFVCNDPGCPARLLVHERDLMEHLHRQATARPAIARAGRAS